MILLLKVNQMFLNGFIMQFKHFHDSHNFVLILAPGCEFFAAKWVQFRLTFTEWHEGHFSSWTVIIHLLGKPFFFYQGFLSRTLTIHRIAGEGRGPSFIPLYHFYPLTNIYLKLCMWDDYHIFLIATLVFTRLLFDEIYHLIELLFEWLMMWR